MDGFVCTFEEEVRKRKEGRARDVLRSKEIESMVESQPTENLVESKEMTLEHPPFSHRDRPLCLRLLGPELRARRRWHILNRIPQDYLPQRRSKCESDRLPCAENLRAGAILSAKKFLAGITAPKTCPSRLFARMIEKCWN